MAMTNVRLTTADLTDVARKIDESADRIEMELKQLDTVMSDLDTTWNDQNAKTYMRRYEELKQEFAGFQTSVRSYGTFLNSVVNTYEKEYNQNIAARVNENG